MLAEVPQTEPVVVLAHGCFDLLHAGHIEHLREAKQHGDKLVVSVTADRFVAKGVGRPHFNQEQRAAHLRALRFVDEVIVNDSPSAVAVIEQVRPHLYVKGVDYAEDPTVPGLAEEIAAVEKYGGEYAVTSAAKLSSSRLLVKLQNGDITDYLDSCRIRGFWSRIAEAFEKARKLQVAFVGETIIDEYRFVSPIGKPSKEFILAVEDVGGEVFTGGIIAAEKHIAKLCATCHVTQEDSIIRKTRFVGRDFTRKLFEVYSTSCLAISDDERARFRRQLADAIATADLLVVMDFGHGLIDQAARTQMRSAKFLAVNAQSNAGNQGFNPITRYRHPDYACVDVQEARLATHMRPQDGSISSVIYDLMVAIEPKTLIITGGRDGAYWRGGQVPALATAPKDTIGAGDAFLAVTAPLIATGLGEEEAAFVGNVAGAMKTEIVGHRAPIDGDVLVQTVKSLLK
jgi:rfaE bifunctional protein nucleotidyltransferase chain/domain